MHGAPTPLTHIACAWDQTPSIGRVCVYAVIIADRYHRYRLNTLSCVLFQPSPAARSLFQLAASAVGPPEPGHGREMCPCGQHGGNAAGSRGEGEGSGKRHSRTQRFI